MEIIWKFLKNLEVWENFRNLEKFWKFGKILEIRKNFENCGLTKFRNLEKNWKFRKKNVEIWGKIGDLEKF